MKKTFLIAAALILFSTATKAETIVVIGDDGVVKQQIVTSNPNGYVATNSSPITVVRENPSVNNTYYYDSATTGNAILAGLTTAVVGTLLYNDIKDIKHHHHKPAPAPAPKHKMAHKGKAPAKPHKR